MGVNNQFVTSINTTSIGTQSECGGRPWGVCVCVCVGVSVCRCEPRCYCVDTCVGVLRA